MDAAIVFLHVADLGRSAAFYAGALELTLVVDQGDCHIYRVGPGGFIGICERPGSVSPEGHIVTIVRDDVEGTHTRLLAHGATVEHAPTHSDHYSITHAFYRDPDGHLVEVQRFDDPNWADA